MLSSLGRGTSAEEVDSFSGPVVIAKALLALVGWRAGRDGRDDPPASAVLVRPAFGAAGPADRGDRPPCSAGPRPPRRGGRARNPTLRPHPPPRPTKGAPTILIVPPPASAP